MDKKELAIVLPVSGNWTFALAVTLMGIKKHLKNYDYDIFVYYQDISEKEKQILNSILPCNFIEYTLDSSTVRNKVMKRYSQLTFSRYECFGLLDRYKKALWIDTDTLIQGNLDELTDLDVEIGAWQTDIHNQFNFTVSLENYDMYINYYNVGVLLVTDRIKNPQELKEWCYKKTVELGEYLVCSDQSILNIMFQEFKINVFDIGEKYNCHPEKEMVKDAVIVHPYAEEKFWNYYYKFKEWNNYYKKWLDMGGTPYKGPRAGLLKKLWIKFRKKYMPEAPDPRRHLKKFIVYLYNHNFRRQEL